MVITLPALAADLCESWGCRGKLETLYTTAAGDIYVGFAADETLSNCQANSGTLFTLQSSKQNFKEVYASLLAAYMADRVISARIDEGTVGCNIAYVTLDANHE